MCESTMSTTNHWIPWVMLLAFSLAISVDANGQEEIQQTKKKFQDGEAIKMTLFRDSGWMITFQHDGRVNAQYGSGLADSAYMPKGTIDFDELLKAAERLRSKKKVKNSSQLVIVRHNAKDDKASYAFYLKDDTLFRYLVGSYESKWKSQINQKAFDKRLATYPIFGK